MYSATITTPNAIQERTHKREGMSQETFEIERKFWFGKVTQRDDKGKLAEFNVSNHMDEDTKYKFRYIGKCRAGFMTICETNYDRTPSQFLSQFCGFIDAVDVWIPSTDENSESEGAWVHVLTTKAKKFHSVDKAFLLSMDVGMMHSCFKKMVDYNLWSTMNTKTHASFAYKNNYQIEAV